MPTTYKTVWGYVSNADNLRVVYVGERMDVQVSGSLMIGIVIVKSCKIHAAESSSLPADLWMV